MSIKEKIEHCFSFHSNIDEERLLFSSHISVLIYSFLFASFIFSKYFLNLMEDESMLNSNSGIYNILAEQEYVDKSVNNYYKALSNVDSAGRGGITKESGFHVLSYFNEFVLGGNYTSKLKKKLLKGEKSKEPNTKDKDEKILTSAESEEEISMTYDFLSGEEGEDTSSEEQTAQSQTLTKIPSNYRFRQDFLFRWDGSRITSMPRKKLEGYEYFKKMINQIKHSFSPPGGGNFAYRDMAGIVSKQGIFPGQTEVSFLLNEDGQVLDVKLMSSQGQEMISQACLDAIRGQNFGKVPEEIKKFGLIFGINFIFPSYGR